MIVTIPAGADRVHSSRAAEPGPPPRAARTLPQLASDANAPHWTERDTRGLTELDWPEPADGGEGVVTGRLNAGPQRAIAEAFSVSLR